MDIKGALTRKFGPLPAWAWLTIIGVGIWYYRNRVSSSSGTGTGSVAPAAATPQSPVTLSPGESVYDPNTGQLLGGGGGGDTGTGGGTSGTSGGSTENPTDTPNVTTTNPLTGTAKPKSKTPKPKASSRGRSHTAIVKPGTRLKGGAIEAKSGPTRPKPISGKYKVVGRGAGRWVDVLKKQSRPKPKTSVKAPIRSHPSTGRPAAPVHPAPRPSSPPKRTVRPVAKKAPAKAPARKRK